MTARRTSIARRAVALALLLGSAGLPSALPAQERGAAALAQAVDGLGVTMRVLMIGAHPDDEDTQLIAGLARGHRVETAYLSLTRGDGGQNLIGNELGEALGAIRTEELLAARRVDGGRQYFARAYDFGFSKSAEETYRHWPKDTLLGDVVRVVRAFRPHVVVAVFSGTPRDGHGHHQVSGLLAREAYEVAGDSARYGRDAFGVEWTPLKFYRVQRTNAAGASAALDVGAYDPVAGRSANEVAGESRSQHKSQGFGALERRGPAFTHVRREASRVGPDAGTAERSLFDGIDTTWGRFAHVRDPQAQWLHDSIPALIAEVQRTLDLRRPAAVAPGLARLRAMLLGVCPEYQTGHTSACATITREPGGLRRTTIDADLERTLDVAAARALEAAQLAAGVELEAEAVREVVAPGAPTRVVVRFHNRGSDSVSTSGPGVNDGREGGPEFSTARYVAPGGLWVDTVTVAPERLTQPWWLERRREGAMFAVPVRYADDRQQGHAASVSVMWEPSGGQGVILTATAPVVHRHADPVRGDVRRPLAVAPAVSVTLDRAIEMVPADTDVRRELLVRLRSADTASREVTVRLALPPGLAADSASRTATLAGHGAEATVAFTVSGRMRPGRDTIHVTAESGGETFDQGYQLVDYPHIRPMRLYRPSALAVQAVDVRVPAGLAVAYVPGVSDNVAPALVELGVDVTVLDPAALVSTDLSRYTTVVIGPRAYEAHPAVMAARARLLDFARAGGTLVIQYQQYEIQQPGVLPYPVRVNRPHDRVTIEEAPVAIVDAAAPVLRAPNAIGPADFDGWVQERSLYMPREIDERWRAPLEMHDPGEASNRGALLVAPLGEGTVVYTTLSLFRQLPAGVPGAARILVNLLAAGRPPVTP